MNQTIRTKKDARLYFTFCIDTGWDLGKVKSELIRLGYIDHVEGDKHTLLKKWDLSQVKSELSEVLNGH